MRKRKVNLNRQEQELIEQMRRDNRREGLTDIGKSDYSTGMDILRQSIEALVLSGIQSNNPDVRKNAEDMDVYLNDKYKGDVSALLKDPSTVNQVLNTAQTWVEHDESIAMDVEALQSSFTEASMTNQQLQQRSAESRNSDKPEERYVRKTSQVDGKTYVIDTQDESGSTYFSEEAWEEKSANTSPNALGWDNEGDTMSGLVDK